MRWKTREGRITANPSSPSGKNAHVGNLTQTTDPLGRVTVFEYAANGVDLVAVKQKVGAGYETLSTFTYDVSDPPHLPRTATDGAGQTTTFAYNAVGQVTQLTNPLGEVLSLTYESDPLANGFGMLKTVTGDVPGGNVAFTYDAFNRVRTASTTDGVTLTYDYDGLDRVRVVTYPDGSYEQLEYEDHSLVASRDRSGRWTRHGYNGLMERIVSRNPAGEVTQFQWCRCGELGRLVDGEKNITEWVRDEQGRVKTKRYADASELSYAYDFSGRLASVTNARGQVKTLSYFLDDALKSMDYDDPATPDVSYAYDADFARPVSRVDGVGTTTFAYHPYNGATLGAGQSALVNGPFPDDTLKYAYDALGRLKKMEIVDDATHSIASYEEEYGFDERGRLEQVDNNLGVFGYAYEGQSDRVVTVGAPNGMTSRYAYEGAVGDRLLKQIKHLSAGTTPSIISQFDYTYTQDRNIATWDITQNGVLKKWTFAHDDVQRLTEGVRRDASNVPVESERYGYDRVGNRTQVTTGTSSPVVRNYSVSNLNQLISERGFGPTTVSGTLDEAATVSVNGAPAKVTSSGGAAPYRFEAPVELVEGSNILTVEASDGSNNTQVKQYEVNATGEATQFVYDADGNLRFEKEPNGDVRREYRWDAQNRLVRVLHGSKETRFEYDGSSRRTRIQDLDGGVEVSQDTYIWCGSRICQKRNAAGSTVRRSYLSGGFLDGVAKAFITKDHLESTREVVAVDGVTVETRYDYGLYGEPQFTGIGRVSDQQYTGHHQHIPTGLRMTWFRIYSSREGRWLSRDPLLESEGLNLYAYVDGTPLKGVDPHGLYVRVIVITWIGADVATPEPTDALWPKWVAYGLLGAGVLAADHWFPIVEAGQDAQAPGQPTEDDGYKCPKNWDGRKVRNPNGPGFGYPDKNGDVWVPTGPNGHGGPHWDVESPGGGYDNVYPGGKRRGGRK